MVLWTRAHHSLRCCNLENDMLEDADFFTYNKYDKYTMYHPKHHYLYFVCSRIKVAVVQSDTWVQVQVSAKVLH